MAAAEVAGGRLVLHGHLPPAMAAVGQALEQRRSGPGHPTAATPVVLLVVVAEDRLDRRVRLAVDVGGVFVGDHELPLLRRQRVLARRSAGHARDESRATVDEGPGIGRVADQARDGCRGRSPPHHGSVVATALATREQQSGARQLADHTVDRSYPKEGGEDDIDPLPHLLVGVLGDAAGQVADQADRQALGQLAAACLVDQAGRGGGP